MKQWARERRLLGWPVVSLATVLGEENVASFRAHAWPSRHLACAGSLARLGEILNDEAIRDPRELARRFAGPAKAWKWQGAELEQRRPQSGELVSLYEQGWVLVFQELDPVVPVVRRVARALERELGLRVGDVKAEAFASLEGARVAPHFDHNATFNIQIAGDKTWQLADNPFIDYPPDGAFLGATCPPALRPLLKGPFLADMPDAHEVFEARPGSVVFVPSGTLHATKTTGPSMALLFTVRAASWASRLARELERKLVADASLRAPATATEDRGALDAAIEIAERALAELRRARAADGEERARLLASRVVRRGLSLAMGEGGASLRLRAGARERVVDLEAESAPVAAWIAAREGRSFSAYDVLENVPTAPEVTLSTLEAFERMGLVVLAAGESGR